MTWFSTLSPQDRRALRFGAPVLLAGLAWKLMLSPLVGTLITTRTQLATERDLLRKEQALVATVTGSSGAVAETGGVLKQQARYLIGGGDHPGAMSALMRYIQSIATHNRVLLARVEPGSPRPAGPGLNALPLQIRGEGDLEGLVSLLYLLETSLKRIQVDHLRISSPRTPTGDPHEVLQFDFGVTGYMLDEGLARRGSAAPREEPQP